jgi:molybdopterin-guanine dinucleotide biosynthesis protein A
MGTDKTLLEYGGISLLERAVHTALSTGCEVAVSGCEQPSGWSFPEIPFVSDTLPYQGPLHGIMRLLDRFDRPVFAIGCDMPLVTTELLNWMLESYSGESGIDGLAAADSRDGIQPLFSIYNPENLEHINANLSEGRLSAAEVIERGRFGIVTIPFEMEQLLYSVDTPVDFEYVDQILREQEAD